MASNTHEEYEIASLLRRERWHRDNFRWTEFRDCWHPDSSKTLVDLTWYKGEIDPFVTHSAKMSSREVIITHNINPAIIDIRGPKAYAESNCLIMSRFPHDGHDYDFSGWCHLVSRLEKVVGTWKMLTLEVIYLRDVVVPVPPAPDPDYSVIKDWPRKSYKFATWHLMMRGLEVRKDLPGWDDEQSVNRVRDRNLAWLDGS